MEERVSDLEYKRIIEEAEVALDKDLTAAGTAYVKALQDARFVFNEVVRSAWLEYVDRKDAALAAYRKAVLKD